MKVFEEPLFERIRFAQEDILTTSPNGVDAGTETVEGETIIDKPIGGGVITPGMPF